MSSFFDKIKNFFKRFFQVKNQKKRNYFYLGLLILIFIFFTFLTIGFTVYFMDVNSPLFKSMIKIFPYPAAVVNWHNITLDDWATEYFAWKKASEKHASQNLDSQLREDVLNKLINEVLANKLAEKFNIEFTNEDIDKEIEIFKKNFNNDQAAMEKSIDEQLGWTFDEFKQRLIRPNALIRKLSEAVPKSEIVWDEARKRADEVLKRLSEGEDFAMVAKEKSDDVGSARKGGDLGWFSRGKMVKEFEDAAFSLEVGQVSGLVKSEFGYHIIKVEDKKIADEANNIEEQVKARHILIAPRTFDDYMKEMLNSAKVWRFIKF